MTELLSLDAVVQRDTVSITSKKFPNGKQYDLANFDDLGVYEHALIVNRDAYLRSLNELGRPLKPAEVRGRDKALKEILSIILPALEPTVLSQIEPVVAAKVINAWSLKVIEERVSENPPMPRTGAAPSRASKRSSAATPRRGSTPPAG